MLNQKRQQKEQKYFVEIYKNRKKDQNVFTIMIICGIKNTRKPQRVSLKIQIKNMKGYLKKNTKGRRKCENRVYSNSKK